ncbi:acyl-CoA dehydrogenase family protein [Actinomadura sp. 9N407]|uniref:acyl-CoA dehydrogenase family protein n=1 Tax=Actinomadura sp. 9N407 TaxID=3375154 RepID=UPI0037A0B6F8
MTSDLSSLSDLSDFSHLHDELRAVARDLLGKAGSGAAVDRRLIAESGWLGLEAPVSLDGAGATFAEVAVIVQEMGRAAARSPYLGTAVLAAGALALLEPGPDRDRLLAETASGAAVPALALAGEGDGAAGFRLERSARGLRLHGRADFVPDAPDADHLLLPALGPDGTPVIVAAGPDTTGLSVTARPVLDDTRQFGLVTADHGVVGEECVWQFRGDSEAAFRRLLYRAATAVACDSLGLSEAMLDATVAYAGVRSQFDRPIGSFQAVKHACADMLVQVSVSRRLVSAAVQALCADGPQVGVAVSMAKSYAGGAAVDITGKAMQLHGGMGYTWESGIHVYLKRAALNRSLFGSPAAHRRRIAERYR